MKICLDVGNSQIFGGVYDGDTVLLKFRHETHRQSTSDQLGIFLKTVLRENDIDASQITHIGISSVVPPVDYSLGSACIKYFGIEPFWIQAGIKTGLKLKVKHPNQVGSDLIATAIAAMNHYPNTNLIVVDFGTATTYVPISANKEFLGAVIHPGVRTSMQALQAATEQLPTVQIVEPNNAVGRDTISCIQSGLYYGQLGACKEIIARMSKEVFPGELPIVIATGGFASLYEADNLFTLIKPDLVLHGVRLALEMNLAA